MITLSYYQAILLVLLVIFSYFSYKQISNIITFILVKRKNNKLWKEKEDSVKKMKESGDIHKWVTLPVNIPGEGVRETQVCETTGYCPAVSGFIEVSQIKQMLTTKKQGEEFQEFRTQRISELANKYNTSKDIFDSIVNDIYSIKQDFHLKKMEESIKELRDMYGDKLKIVSNVDELKDAIESQDTQS